MQQIVLKWLGFDDAALLVVVVGVHVFFQDAALRLTFMLLDNSTRYCQILLPAKNINCLQAPDMA